jgi:hypothetical protein
MAGRGIGRFAQFARIRALRWIAKIARIAKIAEIDSGLGDLSSEAGTVSTVGISRG